MGTFQYCGSMDEVEWYGVRDRGIYIPGAQLSNEKKQELRRWIIESCSGIVLSWNGCCMPIMGQTNWAKCVMPQGDATLFFDNDKDLLLFELKFGPTLQE